MSRICFENFFHFVTGYVSQYGAAHLVPCESVSQSVTDPNAHTPSITQVQHIQNRRTSVRSLENLGRTLTETDHHAQNKFGFT